MCKDPVTKEGLSGENVQSAKVEIEGKITEQVSSFNYLKNLGKGHLYKATEI